MPHNLLVPGSSPGGRTSKIKPFSARKTAYLFLNAVFESPQHWQTAIAICQVQQHFLLNFTHPCYNYVTTVLRDQRTML